MIVLEGQQPLGDDAHQYYAGLVRELRDDPKHVEHVQDLWGDRLTASSVQSPDGKAAYVQLNLAGNQGTTLGRRISGRGPEYRGSDAAAARGQGLCHRPGAARFGHAAQWQQLHSEDHRGNRRDHLHGAAPRLPFDRHRDSAVGHGWRSNWRRPGESSRFSATTIFSYSRRSPSTCWFSSASRPEPITGYSSSVDIKRRVRPARTAETAYYTTYRGVAPVVLASGLTIAGAIFCLSFTRLPYFQTMGIPCAVGMLVAVAVAVTLVPAGIVVGQPIRAIGTQAQDCGFVDGAGSARRSSAGPRPFWLRPCAVALVGLLALPGYKTSYNDRLYIPKDIPANLGYAAAERHFSQTRMMPDILMIEADHDMRNPADFLVLNKLAKAIFQVPGISRVQGITRPEGTPIDHTSIPFLLSLQSAGQAQNMKFQKDRMNDMLKQADDMATMISVMQRQYEVMQQIDRHHSSA